MITYNVIFRATTIVLFLIWWAYRELVEKRADREKPKTKTSFSFKAILLKYAVFLLGFFLLIQLCGLAILPLPKNLFIMQMIGLFLIIMGIGTSLVARKELGTNWTHFHQYQIKRSHELITTSIYRYIRHPIYFATILLYVGTEMVVQSYLCVFFFFTLFFWAYYQGRSEEKILLSHFGNEFEVYRKKTKMIIPFVF